MTSLNMSTIMARALASLILVFLILLPSWQVSEYVSWHDQQRIGQMAIFMVLALILLFHSPIRGRLPLAMWRPFFILSFLGLVSVGGAKYLHWALAEYFVLVATYMIFIMTASFVKAEKYAERAILLVLLVLIIFFEYQFLKKYLYDLSVLRADPFSNFHGFSNIRFFGHFQTITFSMLLLLVMNWRRVAVHRILSFVLNCVVLMWSFMMISNGTRGTWLGLFVAVGVGLSLPKQGQEWGRLMAKFFGGGVFLYIIFYILLPCAVGIEIVTNASTRVSASLSGREDLWHQAWLMILNAPWFGYGPMHFASVPNEIATHPHQAILQIASEFGLIIAFVAIFFVVRALSFVYTLLKRNSRLSISVQTKITCLFLSVVACLGQSMVDGVFVMPYTMVWLAIGAGWLAGVVLKFNSYSDTEILKLRRWKIIEILFFFSALYLSIFSYVTYPVQKGTAAVALTNFAKHYQPRFWQQGIIGL